jgi:hypothetical protein
VKQMSEKSLWQDDYAYSLPLGCYKCPDKAECGGLKVKAPVFDCLSLCCGDQPGCDIVCPRNRHFVDRVREVNTFNLGTITLRAKLDRPALPTCVPLIYHSGSRRQPLKGYMIAVPLHAMYDRKSGETKQDSSFELARRLQIVEGTPIILTGVAKDKAVERWWGIGSRARRRAIRAFREQGAVLATTPNFSLFSNRPRWDDLHAMKRIAITAEEFLEEGLPVALHVNGRTETDFMRWLEHLSQHPEIECLAYEFTTGTRRRGRMWQHAAWLCALAHRVERPLHLVVRGGSEVLPFLKAYFASVTSIDSRPFVKTLKRQRAFINAAGIIGWETAPTPLGAPVDDLFAYNTDLVTSWFDTVASYARLVREAA